jgi:hypothetical protein
VKLGGDGTELQNCGSQILTVRNRSSATFFSPQFRNQIACPQYCGIVEVRTKIADAHLCPHASIAVASESKNGNLHPPHPQSLNCLFYIMENNV